MKCSAYFSDMSQCSNIRIGDSYHCELHRDKAKTLYLKYKVLCSECEEININTYQIKDENVDEQIDEIISYYILYNKAFSTREKHRKYYFISDYHDSGHNYQFIKLNEHILKCEDILMKLYSMRKFDDQVNEVTDETTENNLFSKKRSKFKVEDFKRQRLRLENETKKCLSLYINENSVYLEEKKKLVRNVSICSLKLFYIIDEDTKQKIVFYPIDDTLVTINDVPVDAIYLISILIFELTLQLIKINYFNDLFVKTDAYKITLNLDKTTPYCLGTYLSQFTVDKLKEIYTILLFNKSKIKDLFRDFIPIILYLHEHKHNHDQLIYYLAFDDNDCIGLCPFDKGTHFAYDEYQKYMKNKM